MPLVGLISGVVGAIVSVATLALVLMRGALSAERHITALETKMELFWGSASIVANALQGQAPQNPINDERWTYLLNKFRSSQLMPSEAQELSSAFQEKERKAKEEKDLATLLIIGLGLALLAIVLNHKGEQGKSATSSLGNATSTRIQENHRSYLVDTAR